VRHGAPLAQVHVHHLGGAVARVPSDATAFAHRGASFAVNVVGMWTGSSDTERYVAWAKNFNDALQPHSNGGVYVNFLGNEGEAGVKAAYGEPTYTRLARVKGRYDPENVFRLNQNIQPRRD